MLDIRQAGRRVVDLTKKNRQAICASWPKTNRKLRMLADGLSLIAKDPMWECRNWRGLDGKANVLGLKETTAFEWYTNVGLSEPVFEK